MPRQAVVCIVIAMAYFGAPAVSAETPPPPTIVVHLSNFAIVPDVLHLRAGVAVRLHLVNDSGGGHNWSAPELVAASAFPDGAAPAGGKIELGPQQSADIVLVPRAPGSYRVECTHFLHSLFGMTGRVVVDAALS